MSPRTEAGPETERRIRALRCLLRRYEPDKTPFRRITPEMADALLRWAPTLSDEEILDMRGMGPVLLRWVRDHQPPSAQADFDDTTFALVLKQTGWRVEVFWNTAGGWFTARLISPWDRDGNATYPGGFLAPFDNPLGASGASPAEALSELGEAVLEWA